MFITTGYHDHKILWSTDVNLKNDTDAESRRMSWSAQMARNRKTAEDTKHAQSLWHGDNDIEKGMGENEGMVCNKGA